MIIFFPSKPQIVTAETIKFFYLLSLELYMLLGYHYLLLLQTQEKQNGRRKRYRMHSDSHVQTSGENITRLLKQMIYEM
jgi:hypothetical protein